FVRLRDRRPATHGCSWHRSFHTNESDRHQFPRPREVRVLLSASDARVSAPRVQHRPRRRALFPQTDWHVRTGCRSRPCSYTSLADQDHPMPLGVASNSCCSSHLTQRTTTSPAAGRRRRSLWPRWSRQSHRLFPPCESVSSCHSSRSSRVHWQTLQFCCSTLSQYNLSRRSVFV